MRSKKPLEGKIFMGISPFLPGMEENIGEKTLLASVKDLNNVVICTGYAISWYQILTAADCIKYYEKKKKYHEISVILTNLIRNVLKLHLPKKNDVLNDLGLITVSSLTTF